MKSTTTTVAIVGGGPVGMITALGLARRGIAVRLLESNPGIVPEPRAMTYHWTVLEGMQELDLLDDMIEEGFVLREMCYRIFATDEVIKLRLDALEGHVHHPYSVVLGQDSLERIVLRHLGRYPNVTIDWNTTVTAVEQHSAGVRLTTSQGEVHADWVVGADGGRSVVRKSLGIAFEGMTWPERFVATNVRFDFGKYGWDDCNYLVDPAFGAVIAKVTPDGIWRVTFSEDASLPLDGIEDRIAAYYRAVFPGDDDYEMTLYSAYNMHQRVAETLRVGRIVLAGDAAHLTNPTNGFGLVSGILDAQVLCESLAAVVNGDASDAILDRYAEDRKRVFVETASPSSTETKRLVFHSHDSNRLDRDLARLRSVAADPEATRQQLYIGHRLQTKSIVNV